jgi:hypothetical protein
MKHKYYLQIVLVLLCLFPATAFAVNWTIVPSGTTANLNAVWGSSGTDVFAVGDSGTILHYDGTSWTAMASGTSNKLNGVWGSSGSNIFAVGDSGTILFYNGGTWSQLASPTTYTLYGVGGSSGSDVFAVGGLDDSYGYHYVMLHYNGSNWSSIATGSYYILYSVWSSSVSDVFVGGETSTYYTSGNIFHYDGSSWSTMSNTIYTLYGIWGSSASDVYAMGYDYKNPSNNGAILHYDGTSWTKLQNYKQPLYAVWGSGVNNVFTVGGSGSILHYQGVNWVDEQSGTTVDLHGVWTDSATDAFAVGNGGIILYGGPPTSTSSTSISSSYSTTTILSNTTSIVTTSSTTSSASPTTTSIVTTSSTTSSAPPTTTSRPTTSSTSSTTTPSTTVPTTTVPPTTTTAPPGTPLKADITGCTATDDAPAYVQFFDTSTGNPISWEWVFGDGGTSYERNPLHTYSTAGTFTVALTVTDAEGATDTVIKAQCIKVGSCPDYANFMASPSSGTAPLTVQFTDNSDGPITSRQWIFGDGGTDTVQNPAHTYNVPGTYTVTLIAYGAGCQDTATRVNLITVNKKESFLEKLCSILVSSEDRPDAEKDYFALRNFRDNRLGTDILGNFLVALYYMNSPEVVQILESNPGLRLEFGDIVETYAPRIGFGLLTGSTAFTVQELERIESVLQAIAAKGSPRLRISTGFVLAKLQQPAFLLQYGIAVLP